jgi:YD repeat-containing protein
MLARLGSVVAVAFAAAILVVAPGSAQTITTYTYDALGRLVTSSTPAASTTYTYDNADNRKHLTTCVGTCNHAPTANPDGSPTPINIAYAGSAVIPVLGNDTDPDNDPLIVTSAGPATKGSVTYTSSNVTYQATAGQIGTDSFPYSISDGRSGVSSSSVTVNILPQLPTANAVTNFPVPYNASNYPITLAFTGGVQTSSNVISPGASHGVAAPSGTGIVYTPTPGTSGPDSFYYSGTNAAGTGNQAQVTLIVASAPPSPPSVSDVSPPAFGYNSGSNPITPSISGSATYVSVASQPTSGTATASGTTLYYQPNSTFNGGSDSFTYNATGPGGVSPANATVHIIVNPPAAPTVGSFTVPVGYNSGANTITLQPGGVWSSMAAGPASKGALSAISGTTINYTPNPTATGQDSFTYTATGPAGAVSNTGTVTINIAAAPNPLAAHVAAGASYYVLQTPSGDTGQTPPTGVAVTATGGSGSYSYLWQYVSGDTTIVPYDTGAQSAMWHRGGTLGNNHKYAVWQCKVTDTASAVTYTETVNIEVEESTFQAPQPGG